MTRFLRTLTITALLAVAGSASAATSGAGATLANGILNEYFRNTAYGASTASTVAPYVALFTSTAPTTDAAAQTAVTTGNEVAPSGSGYVRMPMTLATGTWNAPSAGATANTAQLTWTNAPTANWGTVNWFALMDANCTTPGTTCGNGNILVWGTLTTPQAITSGQAAPYFAAGALTITIAGLEVPGLLEQMVAMGYDVRLPWESVLPLNEPMAEPLAQAG